MDFEKSFGSYNTRTDYRESLLFLQRQEADNDNARMRREWFRFLLTMASAKFVMEKHIKYAELRDLARVPKAQDPAWLGRAYQEAPRSLSMDAMQWSHWESPVCPWTTWKASWENRPVHPPPTLRRFTKRSWKERILRKHPKARPISAIGNVSAYNPEHAMRRLPKPAGIGKHRFVEHLDEHPEYTAKLRKEELTDPNNPSFPKARERLRRECEKTGLELAKHRHQNRAVLTEKGQDLWKEKTGMFINKKDYPNWSGDEDVFSERSRRRSNWFRKWFCLGSLPPLPPKKIKRYRAGTADSDGVVEYGESEEEREV